MLDWRSHNMVVVTGCLTVASPKGRLSHLWRGWPCRLLGEATCYVERVGFVIVHVFIQAERELVIIISSFFFPGQLNLLF